jgi:hypothetical protein
MKKETGFIVMAFLLFFFEGAYSQVSQVAYFMKIPQNQFLNPAIKPSDRFYIGLPVITGIGIGAGDNFIDMSDIFIFNQKVANIFAFQDPGYDLAKFARKLKDNNTISADAGLQLFGLGLSFGKDLSIFLDVTDRIAAKAVFPKKLMEYFITGPDQLIGKTFDLSSLNMKGQYYREYGIGFSRNITSNLRIGAKVKLLSGISSFSFDDRSFFLKIDSTLHRTVTPDVTMDVSGRETLNRIFTQNNFLNHTSPSQKTNIMGFLKDFIGNPVSNVGAGFDLGVVYDLGKMFTFSASVTDLGFINWKNDLKSYDSKKSYELPGITLSDVISNPDTLKQMGQELLDTIKKNFVENSAPGSFKTYLPTSISAGASINLLPFLSFGIISNTRFYAGQVQESVTMSGNIYVKRFLSASLSYSIANYSYNNLGFGLAFKTGAVAQFYIIADKIPLSWDKVYFKKSGSSDYSGVPMPSNWNMLNLQIGFNIVFGKPGTRKIDKPMLLESK